MFGRKRKPILDSNRVLDLIFTLAMAAGVTPTKFANALKPEEIHNFAQKVNEKLKAQLDKVIDKAVKDLQKNGIKAKHIKG